MHIGPEGEEFLGSRTSGGAHAPALPLNDEGTHPACPGLCDSDAAVAAIVEHDSDPTWGWGRQRFDRLFDAFECGRKQILLVVHWHHDAHNSGSAPLRDSAHRRSQTSRRNSSSRCCTMLTRPDASEMRS